MDKKYLLDKNFKELIMLVVRPGNIESQQQCMDRIAHYRRAKYNMIDSYITEDEQTYIFEKENKIEDQK